MRSLPTDNIDDPAPTDGIPRKLVILTAIIVLADWLLFAKSPGLSVALFFMALCGAMLLANPSRPSNSLVLQAIIVLIVALLPIIEHFWIISFIYGAIGTALFSLIVTAPEPRQFQDLVIAAVRLLPSGPLQFLEDLGRIDGHVVRRALPIVSIMPWVVPVTFGSLFLWIFAMANPLVEGWLSHIEITELIRAVDVRRLLFWLVIFVMVWPFIFMKSYRGVASIETDGGASPETAGFAAGMIFGDAAILRSLLLFNALFAIETTLDLTYLWGGVTLPDGMSYASYAHRGAYPLVITALLAGGFVIAAMKPGSPSEGSRMIRVLVYLWVAQNILLVGSSILRLDIYVQFYALTYLRIAAFVWMSLVAIGLALIIVRIIRRYSNGWLLSANIGALGIALYVCCFVNFPYVVARFNVEHCREISGQGPPLDMTYLLKLGPNVIPALDDYARRLDGSAPEQLHLINGYREASVASRIANPQDWRAWSFREWRLARYLDRAKKP